jgi:flagellar hook-associated protein 2
MIDVNGIVSGLMALEQRPLQTIKSRISATQVSVSSMTEVKGLVSAAATAAKALSASSLLSGKSISSSNEAIVKVSVTDSTLAGVASIPIKPVEIARAQRSTLAGFASATAPIAALDDNGSTQFGTLTIDIPVTSTLLSDADGDGQTDSFTPVEITLGGRTLSEVRDEINAQLAGKLSASIINTGDPVTGYVLVVTGSKTGVDADFTMSLDADTLLAREGSGLKLGAEVAAQASITLGESVVADLVYDASADDAHAELFSGTGSAITVRSTSNLFSDVLPGVQFELIKKPAVGETSLATISITENTADVESKLTSFANAYSDLVKRLRVLTRPGSADQQAGPLASNAGVLSLTSALSTSYFNGLKLSDARTYTTSSGNVIGGANSPIAWSSLGLKMARDGTVSLDVSELRRTLSSGLGASIREGFTADLTDTLNTFGGSGSGLQTTIQTIELSLSSLKTRQSDLESRLERTRQGLVKKYAALDAKLVQMNQMSTNVRSALAGLSA